MTAHRSGQASAGWGTWGKRRQPQGVAAAVLTFQGQVATCLGWSCIAPCPVPNPDQQLLPCLYRTALDDSFVTGGNWLYSQVALVDAGSVG